METSNSKTLLVTGGAGFIGCNFVRMCVARGHKVIVLDALTYAGHRENLENIKGPGEMELVVGSVADPKVVSGIFKSHAFDVVVNFAAESHVDRSIDGPGVFIETNIVGTYTMLNSAYNYWLGLDEEAKNKFRFIQISTDEVYGELGDTGKFTEKTCYQPNSPYSASKAAGDHLARAWFHTFGFPAITTNCSNNYGPYQFPEKLIPTIINCALHEKPLPVYGEGKNIRDWIQVEDHCRGIWKAIDAGLPGETYCFGGNAERNNLSVVQTICRELDSIRPRSLDGKYEDLIEFVKDRPGHDWRYAIDDTKAKKELGFKREYSFEEGLKQAIYWYIDNEDWMNAVLEKKQ